MEGYLSAYAGAATDLGLIREAEPDVTGVYRRASAH